MKTRNDKVIKVIIAVIAVFEIIARVFFICVAIGVVFVMLLFTAQLKKADSDVSEIFVSEETVVLYTLPKYDDGFQYVFGARDFTVYGEYYYSNLTDEILEDNEFFQPVSMKFDETVLLKNLVNYYEEKITHTRDDSLLGDDLNKYYRFDEITIDGGDWYYLETDRAADYDVVNDEVFKLMCQDFDLYYYDAETKTIFLMHDDV